MQSRGYFPFFIPSNNDYGYDKVKKELGKEVAYHSFFPGGKMINPKSRVNLHEKVFDYENLGPGKPCPVQAGVAGVGARVVVPDLIKVKLRLYLAGNWHFLRGL